MVTSYIYNDNTYYFYYDDNSNFLRIVEQRKNMEEKQVRVRVHNSSEFTLKINKYSLSAAGGALGLFKFIADCIKTELMIDCVNWIVKECFQETFKNFR